MVSIPAILIERLSAIGTQRFIRVAKNDKIPIDKGWQKIDSLRHPEDPVLQAWLEDGGNYGVVGGRGLVIIDADTEEIDQVLTKTLPKTFSVKSPGSGMLHRYYRSNLEKPVRLKNKGGENIGDIQGVGKQALGPDSIHPNGKKYEIYDSRPITYVSEEKLRSALEKWIVKEKVLEDNIQKAIDEGDITSLTIREVISHYGIKLKPENDELCGPHPVHGSTGGKNFWVNPKDNVWHCFRCDSGGGPLGLVAVMEGIIDCPDAVTGVLRGITFSEVIKKAQNIGLLVDTSIKIKIGSKEVKIDPYQFFILTKEGQPKKFIAKRLADAIQRQYHFVSFDKKSYIYYYKEEEGIWGEKGELMIRSTAYYYLGSLATSHYVEEAVKFIRDTNYIPREQLDYDIRRIPVKNGVLNLETFQLEPFRFDFFGL